MEMLRRRVERLAKFLEEDLPDLIICEGAFLVFKAACSLNPEMAGKALAQSIKNEHAYEKKLCLICGDEPWRDSDTSICSKCIKQCEDEEKDIEDE